MSWFKGAFDRVKEKGAAVKGIAKDVAHKTREVRSRLIGASTTADLQTQLEVRAGSLGSVGQVCDTLRGWLSNMQADDQLKGSRFNDSLTEDGRQLTFTQVLLRSSAIEEALAVIVCSPQLRSEISAAWASVREASPDASPSSDRTHANSDMSESQIAATYLHQFLSKVLVGDQSVWSEIVSLLLTPHGHDSSENPKDSSEEDAKIRERADSSADWLARCQRSGFRAVELGMISKLKRDWYDEYLETERRDLGSAVDLKRNELFQRSSATATPVFADASGSVWHRIRLSGEMVDLYESIKDNLDNCTMHRSETKKEIFSALDETRLLAESGKSSAESDQLKSVERQVVVKQNSDDTEKDMAPKLMGVGDERRAVDDKITGLEGEKLRLRMELERVSGELLEAQKEQRAVMDKEDKLRAELINNRERFAAILIEEIKEEQENKIDSELNARCLLAVQAIKEKVEALYREDGNQLNEIYTQFDNAFLEAVQDHMTVLCESVQDIYRRVKRLADEMESVKRTKNSQSMSEMLNAAVNENEKEEFNASLERLNVRIMDIESRMRTEADEVEKFGTILEQFFRKFESRIASNRLLKGEVDKVNVVLGEAQRVLKKYQIEKQAAEIEMQQARTPQVVLEEEITSPREESNASI